MSSRDYGFTLIELMVTLAVAAVVLGIGIPSFNSTVLNNRSLALGGELASAINFARAEAVKRSARVSICPSSDGAVCLGSGDWAKGWMVFTDTSASDTTATATVGVVLRHWGDLNNKSVVTAKKGSTALAYLRFTSNGALARSNAADVDPRVFEAHIEGCKNKSKGKLNVGIAGLVSSVKVDCP